MKALPLVAAAYCVAAYSAYKYHLFNKARLDFAKITDKPAYFKELNDDLASLIDHKLDFFENSNNLIRLR